MDASFPAVERYLSHVSARIPSVTESSIAETPDSEYSHHEVDPEKALTPQVSRHSQPPLSKRVTTRASTYTQDPSFEVDWEDADRRNPRNWPTWYKGLIIFAISYGTLMVVLYSTSYTAGIAQMAQEFHTSDTVVTLGVTTYLIGIAVGSLVLAPISETYGRKWVYAISMICFVILILPCAKATSVEGLVVVRFFAAVAGSAMIANAPGTIADIVDDDYRATAFSIWSLGPMNGPVLGPVIGGFVTQYKGWRWANWVVMMGGGFAMVLMLVIKETYEPALLQRKAKRLRKETGDDRYWSRFDQRLPFVLLMKVNLSRPFIMAVKEPICIFWNLYIGIIYGILYLCFVAYPIVFTQMRGWSTGMSGLAFVGIGIGSMITICSAGLLRRMINAHKPDADGNIPPEAMMSVVCIAAICIPVGELWFAWTCYPTTIHWAIPIASGIFFGAGNGACFIYSGTYLAHSYGIYAASAMAGNAVVRSFLGGTLPLAGPAMYKALGPNWAGTMLGLLEVVIVPIPFLFYRYGAKIRERSPLIRQMREIEEHKARKRERAEQKLRNAENTGGVLEQKLAQAELTRVNSSVADYDSSVDTQAQAELTQVEGLQRDAIEKELGQR